MRGSSPDHRVSARCMIEARCCLRSSDSRCRFAAAASASFFCRTSRFSMVLAAKSVHLIVWPTGICTREYASRFNSVITPDPPPSANNASVADFLYRQCVLVPFAAPKIWLDGVRGDRAFRKGQTQTNRAPVSDVEVSIVILEQGVHAPVKV